MSGRVPDGARVDVLQWGEGRRWLEVRAPDGRRGWIVARYLARARAVDPLSRLNAVWRSAATCAASTPSPRPPGHARIASWNLRWFPDGSSRGPSAHPTDVPWMACTMASLNADVIAVQEVMLHARGAAAIENLTRRLSALTGGRWQSRFDECPRDGRQHVGWLFDAARVQLTNVRQLDSINPLGACSGHLRPGLSAQARFLDARELALVTVHLDSGTDERDYRHRIESVEQLATTAARLTEVLIVGDFNTMGAGSVDAAREISGLDARFGRAGLRRVTCETGCTEFYRRRGGLLDLAIVSAGLRSSSTLEVVGPCAELNCALPRGAHPEALARLSDHCPIVVDLAPAR